MRIFHVSDIEGGLVSLVQFINFVNKEAGKSDVVVVSGDVIAGPNQNVIKDGLDGICKDGRISVEDYAELGKRSIIANYEMAKSVLEKSSVPVLFIPGNHDYHFGEDILASERLIPLHKRVVDVGGLSFAGIGGADIAVSDSSLFVMEQHLGVRGSSGYRAAKMSSIYDFLASLERVPNVLVCHMPPHRVLDNVRNHGCVGSVGLRDYLDENTVPLVLCGHVHENPGMQFVNSRTVVSNAGTLRDDSFNTFAMIEFDGIFRSGVVYKIGEHFSFFERLNRIGEDTKENVTKPVPIIKRASYSLSGGEFNDRV